MAVSAARLRATAPPMVVAPDFDDAFPGLFLLAFRAAHRILRDVAAAEDVAADVLARVHDRWGRLGGAGHRDAWVVRVATNRALDVVRRGPAPALVAAHRSFEDEVAGRLALSSALRRLSRRQQEAIAMRFLLGLAEHEVAAVLGIAEGSVRRHIDRGLRRLRAGMEER